MTSKLFISFCGLILIATLAASLAQFLSHSSQISDIKQNSAQNVVYAYATTTLSIGTTTISVQIADTDILQEHGLSDRTSLASDVGMLFVFSTDQMPGFWMKDMHFPLDIIWIDASSTVTDITRNLSPDSYPHIVMPSGPIRSVLEVNAGFAAEHDIHVGDPVKVI